MLRVDFDVNGEIGVIAPSLGHEPVKENRKSGIACPNRNHWLENARSQVRMKVPKTKGIGVLRITKEPRG
jgi:hypothetical protein